MLALLRSIGRLEWRYERLECENREFKRHLYENLHTLPSSASIQRHDGGSAFWQAKGALRDYQTQARVV